MRLLLLMLPCAWALIVPVQPPLVCLNIFNYYPDLAALNPGTVFYESKNYCNMLETVVCSGMFAGQYLSNITVIVRYVNSTFKGSGINLTYMDWFKYQRTAL